MFDIQAVSGVEPTPKTAKSGDPAKTPEPKTNQDVAPRDTVQISDGAKAQNLIDTLKELLTGTTGQLVNSIQQGAFKPGAGGADLSGVLSGLENQQLDQFLAQQAGGLTPEAQQAFGLQLNNLQTELTGNVLGQLQPQIQSNLISAADVNNLLTNIFDRIGRTIGF